MVLFLMLNAVLTGVCFSSGTFDAPYCWDHTNVVERDEFVWSLGNTKQCWALEKLSVGYYDTYDVLTIKTTDEVTMQCRIDRGDSVDSGREIVHISMIGRDLVDGAVTVAMPPTNALKGDVIIHYPGGSEKFNLSNLAGTDTPVIVSYDVSQETVTVCRFLGMEEGGMQKFMYVFLEYNDLKEVYLGRGKRVDGVDVCMLDLMRFDFFNLGSGTIFSRFL